MPAKYHVKIKCTTLFDITRTGVNTRRQEHGVTDLSYQKKRNQQSNFETVIQLIGLRSQPEDINYPEKIMMTLINSNMGTEYNMKSKIPVWTFTFVVHQPEIFEDDDDKLGKLVQDCSGVPMITGLEEWSKLGRILETSVDFRNIYFEVIDNEQNRQDNQ